MLSIKRHIPSKLSLIHLGLSAKSYIVETVASLGRRFASFRSRHEYVGRKSVVGGGALLMGFFGSIYVLFALQPQSPLKVATPAEVKTASSQTTTNTPTGGDVANPNVTGEQEQAAPATAAAPTLSSNGASSSQSPSYASGVATSVPSLVTSPSAATPSAPAPVAAAPTVQPGMGSTTPTASTTTTPPITSPTPPVTTSPPSVTNGPITTLQQTVLPRSTEPIVSPVTNTIDTLIR